MMNNSSKIATNFDTILRIFLIPVKVIILLSNSFSFDANFYIKMSSFVFTNKTRATDFYLWSKLTIIVPNIY